MLRMLGLTLLALIGAARLIDSATAADNGFIVGDSLGVGVTMASHLRSVAKNSVSIRANAVPIQMIQQAAPGTTVFLSLGTNDAVGNIEGLDGGITKIVQAADAAKVKLVWMGPPCVFKPWNTNAVALDAELKTELKATDVVYVSMHDGAGEPNRLCDRSIRAPDGVHFSMTGYHYMWDRARGEFGLRPARRLDGRRLGGDAAQGNSQVQEAEKEEEQEQEAGDRRPCRRSTLSSHPGGAGPGAEPPIDWYVHDAVRCRSRRRGANVGSRPSGRGPMRGAAAAGPRHRAAAAHGADRLRRRTR